jgi:hypothetical protein
MKIICLIKITCPLKNGIAPKAHPPTLEYTWLDTFLKYSDPYMYITFDFNEYLYHHQNQQGTFYRKTTDINPVLLFNNEEELNTWANNCRLTDPQLIADQEMWETAHGITITYEYYSLSPTIGPDPVI